MSTQSRTVPIPEQLNDWRPACELAEACPEALPACSNAATHVMLHHGRCGIALTCIGCYTQYIQAVSEWAAEPDCDYCCKVCRSEVDPLTVIRLEKI